MRAGLNGVLISGAAALLLPVVFFVLLPLNIFAANVEELTGLAELGLFAVAAFTLSGLLFWLFFLRSLRSPGRSTIPRTILALALCVLLWRLAAGVGEHMDVALLQMILDLAAVVIALLIAFRMQLRNLYVTAGAVSLCLLATSAISHAALVVGHASYFLGSLTADLPPFAGRTDQPGAGPAADSKAKAEPGQSFTGNVYHFVLDGFQGEIYEALRDSRPALPGFTYFPNFVSNSGRTVWSNAMLIRGAPLSELGEAKPMDWVMEAYGDRLWADLRRGGVAVHQYPHYAYYCFDGAIVCKPSADLLKTKGRDIFADLWFLALVPQSANQVLSAAVAAEDPIVGAKDDWDYGFSVTRYLSRSLGIDPRDIPAYSVQLFETMLREEADRPATGQYVFVHLIIPHGPHVLNEDCTYLAADPEPGTAYQAIVRQHKCALHVVKRLTARLQELGRLDTSLIVVHSDHGALWHPSQLDAMLGRPDSGEAVHRVSVDEDDSAVWPSEMIEVRSSALLLLKLPGAAEESTALDAVQTIDVAPTVLRGFGLPVDGYSGTALQHGPVAADRPVVFFANNIEPDGNWPAVFSEYRRRNGRWSFHRNIDTGH